MGVRADAVVPDALTSAKALGGGLPIGALVTGPRLADVLRSPAITARRSPAARWPASAALVGARDLLGPGPARVACVELGERLAAGLATLPYAAPCAVAG